MADDPREHETCFGARTMRGRAGAAQWRTPAWTAVAAVVHAVALAALMLAPVRRARDAAAPSPPTEATEITIALENEPPGERDRAGERRDEEARAATASAAGAIAEPRSMTRSATATPATAASGEAATAPVGSEGRATGASAETGGPPTASSGGTGGVEAIPFSAAELGIGGTNPFLPRREEKAPAGADHPAARAMRGTGLARDRELGLGPEGPAIKALEGATTSSIAPLRGRAMFVIRTGEDGVVSAIDLVDSEGGPGWADAGRIALESLRGKKIRVPRGATGLNMHIEVRSDMKLPNGEDAPFGARRGENGVPELTMPDISNIGSKPRRVVHARATGTEVL
ncbi:MAG: hypothetical protein JWO86_1215 [Myxococcaceae bacterium]|nr:hypothetical protein [Myxococcaceae bacterium]